MSAVIDLSANYNSGMAKCEPGCTCKRHYERTPEMRANMAAAVKCAPDCTCKRHDRQPCPEDCTCGHHRERTPEARAAYSAAATRRARRICPPDCTCGRHQSQKGIRRGDRELGKPYNVGDTKVCNACGVEKPRSEFSPTGSVTKTGRPVLRPACKPCMSTQVRDWQKRTGYAVRQMELRRKRELPQRYGITVEQYDELLARQDGGCGICGSRESTKGHRHPVDHDHESGKVRGILCDRCNRALGLLHDDADLLRKAIKYLEAGCPFE